jgi:hypothetical protein
LFPAPQLGSASLSEHIFEHSGVLQAGLVPPALFVAEPPSLGKQPRASVHGPSPGQASLTHSYPGWQLLSEVQLGAGWACVTCIALTSTKPTNDIKIRQNFMIDLPESLQPARRQRIQLTRQHVNAIKARLVVLFAKCLQSTLGRLA